MKSWDSKVVNLFLLDLWDNWDKFFKVLWSLKKHIHVEILKKPIETIVYMGNQATPPSFFLMANDGTPT